MRILLIGPTGNGGSIAPYLTVLTEALRRLGAHVDRLGSLELPYDQRAGSFWPAERIIRAAEALLRDVVLSTYDVLSVHFGNLEIEQLLPSLWRGMPRRPPAVYHVHSLDWTLFTTHVPEPALRAVVDDGIQDMESLVYFGVYAQRELVRKYDLRGPAATVWLPTTIPANTRARAVSSLRSALTRDHGSVGTLYGYAAPWKDPAGLIDACHAVAMPCRIVLAGPFWDDPREAGTELTSRSAQHGRVHVDIVPTYLGDEDRKALVVGSDFAVFPYKAQPTFQGSGAIADYLAHGVPVLATDVANMAELVAGAGITVPPEDPQALAAGIDSLVVDKQLHQTLSAKAQQRAHQFSAAHHAARCLRLYEEAADKAASRREHAQCRQPNSSLRGTAKPTATASKSSADPGVAAG